MALSSTFRVSTGKVRMTDNEKAAVLFHDFALRIREAADKMVEATVLPLRSDWKDVIKNSLSDFITVSNEALKLMKVKRSTSDYD